MEKEKTNKSIKINLDYNKTSHLYTLPIVIGTKNLDSPFHCVIDF